MTLETAREHLKKFGKDTEVLVFDQSSATVELAAAALGVIPARIAKTLSFKTNQGVVLIVTAGDAKIDNQKYKGAFHCKAKMLTAEELEEFIGHTAGGVCPFGLKDKSVQTYTDISLRRFQTVFPACGSSHSAIELTCDDLYVCAESLGWIDVCKDWQK